MNFVIEVLTKIMQGSGFAAIPTDWRQLIMIVVACVLLYLGIGRGFEPHRLWYAVGQPAPHRPVQPAGL